MKKRKLLTLGFMLLFVLCYDICEEQIGIGMTLLVDSEIDKTIFGWQIPTIWFQIINPCVIIFGTPILDLEKAEVFPMANILREFVRMFVNLV